MPRPTGVSILAVLNFLCAGSLLLGGLLAFAGGAIFASLMRSAGGGLPVGMAAAFGAFAGVICLIFAALSVIVGYGLWTLKPWGRILLIVLACLGLGLNLLGLAASFAFFFLRMFVMRLIVTAIYVLILWYMFQPHVKQAFGAGAPVATATP